MFVFVPDAERTRKKGFGMDTYLAEETNVLSDLPTSTAHCSWTDFAVIVILFLITTWWVADVNRDVVRRAYYQCH